METNALTSASGAAGTDAARAATGLGSDDFLQLLITQLTNQDPLEPTSNQELLNQISSIREIELNTSLSESLQNLSTQQRFASAAALIGHYVTAAAGTTTEDGQPASGLVTAVRFDASGQAVLELDSGAQLPLEQIGSVLGADSVAELYVGRYVRGLDRSDPENPVDADGLVVGATTDADGQVRLELDTGQTMLLSDVSEWLDEETTAATTAGDAA